jgi:hypothetical protein
VQPSQTAGSAGTAARCDTTGAGKLGAAPCDRTVVAYDANGFPVPITPGRDLAPPSPWNVWTDFSMNRTDDDRSRARTEIRGTFFGLGIDRYVAENTVLGIQFQFEQSDRDSFDGLMAVNNTTVSVGPYFSMLLHQNWSASGLVTVGKISSDVNVAELSGSFDRNQARASVSATGQYFWGPVVVRPSASLDYTYTNGSDIDLVGTIRSVPARVQAGVDSGWMGTFTPSVEFSRVFSVNSGLIVPFTELGATYAFGESGSAFSASQDPEFEEWSGTIAAGVRFSAQSGFFLEASFAYNSLFQQDLDSVEVGLFAAWNF